MIWYLFAAALAAVLILAVYSVAAGVWTAPAESHDGLTDPLDAAALRDDLSRGELGAWLAVVEADREDGREHLARPHRDAEPGCGSCEGPSLDAGELDRRSGWFKVAK